jgi:hypothetical protein
LVKSRFAPKEKILRSNKRFLMGAKIKINSNSSEVLESRGRLVFFLVCASAEETAARVASCSGACGFCSKEGLAGCLRWSAGTPPPYLLPNT